MRKDKKKALVLRQEGKSYSVISAELGVPKSTLSYWLRDVSLSGASKKRLFENGQEKSIQALVRRNKLQTKIAEEKADGIKKVAIEEVDRYIDDPLFLAGVSLYWAEGYKRGAFGSKWKCVDFVNADPAMVRLMMRFFREICGIDELVFRAQLIAHRNVNIGHAVGYWSRITGIPPERFIKTNVSIRKKDANLKNKRKSNILPNGTLHVRIYDVRVFFRIIGWIEGIQERFLVKGETSV